MSSWEQFAIEAPDLADAVRSRFEANKHHVLATLRDDGSPRVSGTEVQFHGGQLTMGSMPQAVKARDLQRDGRFALHANPGDGSMDGGDAKVSGRAIEVTDTAVLASYGSDVGPPPGQFHLFRLDLTQVVRTSLHPNGELLVIESWRPGAGVARVERA